MPSVQRVHDALQGRDVAVMTVSIDGAGEKAVKSYIAEHGFTIPILLDPRMETARKFGVRAVPTTYIINRVGMIVARGIGPVAFDSPQFAPYIEALLAQPRG